MEGSGGKRAEAERWLEIAGKLLMARDLVGSKKFAVRAQESDPLLDGVDQILAVADVLLAAEKRINNHMDWYAILQLDHKSHDADDLELIKRQYRKFALLLHPDKNKSVFADNAFKLVSDAWTVLSDPSKKSLYDNELNLFLKFDPVSLNNPQSTHQTPPPQPQHQQQQQQQETAVRRSTREKRKPGKGTEEPISQPRNENRTESRAPTRSATRSATRMSSFWTACPYCYNLYEYPRVYEECCLRCQNCRRAFHAAVIPAPPPVVPGQEAYYCCWAFFPLGFQVPSFAGGKNSGLPNWTPFSTMCPASSQPSQVQNNNPFGSKIDSDKDDDGGDGNGDMDGASDGSWDHCETGSRKKGKSSVEVKKGPVIKKTARKSVPPRSTRGNVIEPLQDGPVVRGFEGNVLPNKLTPQKNMKKAVARKPTRRAGKIAPESEIVDLNADVKLEFDDPNSTVGDGVEVASGDEDPIAGIGFFEGLDDILGNLGNLPILSVPADQNKVAETDA
ncbi:DnaJ domain [Macleaya cordata]|uniref:DnaJ domain n=1 Tax=Macleaya cordata TaxID=56857 RepID=A0A200PU84_MACCD|nr:DnaJ domain [Macleaya cordata]